MIKSISEITAISENKNTQQNSNTHTLQINQKNI